MGASLARLLGDDAELFLKLELFQVTGTVAGATVRLYSDGTLIGSAVASGTTTIYTTDGATTLSDGVRSITARQE